MHRENRSGFKLIIHRPATLGRRPLILLGAVVLGFALACLWLLAPFWRLAGQFGDHPSRQPSRLYARATVLEVGQALSWERLEEELAAAAYRRVGEGSLRPGSYERSGGTLRVFTRTFPTAQGQGGGQIVEIVASGRRLARLRINGEAAQRALLEPPLVATFLSPELEERRPVSLDDLPEEVVLAVLAAEDEGFFQHSGVSLKGVLRAVWVNLRGGEVSQGGSTLTQQLVKNLYLTHERTWGRKLREAALAMLLEMRFSKRQILNAYLNEIYLGASNGVNLIGIGAAARAYFGKDATQLDLAEAALLAGIIPAPGRFTPLVHPERAQQRRDLVLTRLEELGWLDAERLAAARQRPVELAPQPPVRRRAPYFADAMAAEAARRFGVEALDDTGYSLLSTLSWRDQQAAEAALERSLEELEKSWERRNDAQGPLEAALVSLDPASGAILAYVGGRNYALTQFDRAGQARRQAGSAFKPVVYAAALEAGVAAPSSMVEDAPLTVTLAGRRWQPRNDDNDFRGWVSVRTALEKSLNVPTARLALQSGLSDIVSLAHGLGVTAPLEPYPALALGAFEVTPTELATVYASLAAGGVRPPVHGLQAVLDRTGQRLPGGDLPARQQVLSAESAYLLTSLLQGVLDRGTARGVRALGVNDALAGKTGTTNGRRDSWFAGYSPDRATVVWVGYDDNSATHLSGARAALPIWGRFTTAVRPLTGYPSFRPPPGIVTALIDPASGELATDACPEVLTEVFRQGQVPRTVCHLHGSWYPVPAAREPQREEENRRSFRRWLKRVFGGGDDERSRRQGG